MDDSCITISPLTILTCGPEGASSSTGGGGGGGGCASVTLFLGRNGPINLEQKLASELGWITLAFSSLPFSPPELVFSVFFSQNLT